MIRGAAGEGARAPRRRWRAPRRVARTPQPTSPGQPACQYPVVSPRGHVAAWPGRPYRVSGMPAGGWTRRLILLCRRHLALVLAVGYQVTRATSEALGCEHRVARTTSTSRPSRTPGSESSTCRPSPGSAPVGMPAEAAWPGLVRSTGSSGGLRPAPAPRRPAPHDEQIVMVRRLLRALRRSHHEGGAASSERRVVGPLTFRAGRPPASRTRS